MSKGAFVCLLMLLNVNTDANVILEVSFVQMEVSLVLMKVYSPSTMIPLLTQMSGYFL